MDDSTVNRHKIYPLAVILPVQSVVSAILTTSSVLPLRRVVDACFTIAFALSIVAYMVWLYVTTFHTVSHYKHQHAHHEPHMLTQSHPPQRSFISQDAEAFQVTEPAEVLQAAQPVKAAMKDQLKISMGGNPVAPTAALATPALTSRPTIPIAPADFIHPGAPIRNVLVPGRWEQNEKLGCKTPPPPLPPSIISSITLPACFAIPATVILFSPTNLLTRLLTGYQTFSLSKPEPTSQAKATNEDTNDLLPLWAITGFATLCLLLGAGLKICDISTDHLDGPRVYWYSMFTIAGAVVVAIGTVIRSSFFYLNTVIRNEVTLRLPGLAPGCGDHVVPAPVAV
ncbi:hypothetical protein FRC12_000647 [Ceratobasidium sp. 428]|nr:hypothetical protein FRC12_000647 [Ceratobasidium sp. 428]